MNLKKVFASIGLAIGTTFAIATAPVQAANFLSNSLGLPTLSPDAPVGSGLFTPSNAFPYQTTAFTPAKQLRVRFSLLSPSGLGSRGQGLSNFGFFSPNLGKSSFTSIFSEAKAYNSGSTAKSNDWLGTCGNAIAGPCEQVVTFVAGQTYQLGLLSTGLSAFGVGSPDQYTFDKVSDQYYDPTSGAYNSVLSQRFVTLKDPGALFIGMEDGEYRKSGNLYYYDYQDWVVKAEAVPEPATLAGLGIVAGSLLMARRRKATQSA